MYLLNATKARRRFEADLTIRVDGILTGQFINIRPPYYLYAYGARWRRLPKWVWADLGGKSFSCSVSYVRAPNGQAPAQ